MDFFAGIENTIGIENLFSLFKKGYYFLTVHLFEIRRSYKSVIVFASCGAFVLSHNIINLLCDNRDVFSNSRIGDVHKWNYMKISVSDMACNCIDKFWMFFEDFCDLWNDLAYILG